MSCCSCTGVLSWRPGNGETLPPLLAVDGTAWAAAPPSDAGVPMMAAALLPLCSRQPELHGRCAGVAQDSVQCVGLALVAHEHALLRRCCAPGQLHPQLTNGGPSGVMGLPAIAAAPALAAAFLTAGDGARPSSRRWPSSRPFSLKQRAGKEAKAVSEAPGKCATLWPQEQRTCRRLVRQCDRRVRQCKSAEAARPGSPAGLPLLPREEVLQGHRTQRRGGHIPQDACGSWRA